MLERLLPAVGLAAALLLTALLYRAGLEGGFLLDDGPNILQAWIPDPDPVAIWHLLTHNGSGPLGRSVSMLGFVLSGLQYGLEARGYKVHNLLLHLLIGVLLYRLLLRLLPSLLPPVAQQRVRSSALLVTALWLLHPLQVSTVLYVVQRMSQLAALFSVLALLLWLQARRPELSCRQYLLCGWLLFPLCVLLALLSKESGALIPLQVAVVELFVFRSGPQPWWQQPRLRPLMLLWVLLPLLLAPVLLLLWHETLLDYSARHFSLGTRLLTQLHVLCFYLRLILLPRLRDMSLFHDDFRVTTTLDAGTALLGLLLLTTVLLCWRLRHKMPGLCFGIAWFLACHALESTLLPLELVFEHRNYLALLGPMLAAVSLLAGLRRPAFALALALAAVLLLATLTALRAREWGDRELFHAVALAEHPQSPRAINAQINLRSGRSTAPELQGLLERLVAAAPQEPGVYLHRLLLHCDVDAGSDASLWQQADARLQKAPVSVYTLNALQALVLQLSEGRCVQLDAALLDALLARTLQNPRVQANAGSQASLLRLRGQLAFAAGRYAQGYAFFMLSHERNPEAGILLELIRYELGAGRVQDAAETLVVLEQQAARRLGGEAHVLRLARQQIAAAQATAAAAAE